MLICYYSNCTPVDPPAPSCQEGLYLPQFVHPTPAHGQRIHAEVNKEVEIRIKAQASYAAWVRLSLIKEAWWQRSIIITSAGKLSINELILASFCCFLTEYKISSWADQWIWPSTEPHIMSLCFGGRRSPAIWEIISQCALQLNRRQG